MSFEKTNYPFLFIVNLTYNSAPKNQGTSNDKNVESQISLNSEQ